VVARSLIALHGWNDYPAARSSSCSAHLLMLTPSRSTANPWALWRFRPLTAVLDVTILVTSNMHVITQAKLREFAKAHPAADVPLRVWESMMRVKKYKTPHDVKEDFPSVDFIGGGKTVFDIGGNKFRLVVKVLYRRGWVLIRHILTHKEYDKKIKDKTL